MDFFRNSAVPISSEELEVLKIQEEIKVLEQQKKVNSAALKKLKSGLVYRPARSTKPLTVPIGFDLRLERSHGMKLRGMGGVKSEKTKLKAKKSSSGLTIPEPFLLQTSIKHASSSCAHSAEAASPYVPLAVKVKEFEKTPKRFKTKVSPLEALKHSEPQLTQPQSPQLMTKLRSQFTSSK